MVTMFMANGLHAYKGIGLVGKAGTVFQITTDKSECDFTVATGESQGIERRNNVAVLRRSFEVVAYPVSKCLQACVRTISASLPDGGTGIEQYDGPCDIPFFAIGRAKFGPLTTVRTVKSTDEGDFREKVQAAGFIQDLY